MSVKQGSQIGKHVVIRKLAEGGMAEIFLCSSLGPQGFEKEVVVKRIREPFHENPKFVEMFVAEAKLASRCSHPNLVQIFDFGMEDQRFYLVMEYVPGKSLAEVRNRARKELVAIPPVLVAQIGEQVAKGLHHAHELREEGRRVGLVHRDVSPHNVLLSFDGSVKLTDFGIAKRYDKPNIQLTAAGELKGKYSYMSPEQADREKDLDARSDVFSLGIVLWELLTGGRLFSGDSQGAILRAVRQSMIAEPSRLNPEVPADIGAAVMKALSRDRAQRYSTAAEMAHALGEAVLHHSRSIHDHDLAAFLARLFPDEMALYRERAPARGVSGSAGTVTKNKGAEAGEWISFNSLLPSSRETIASEAAKAKISLASGGNSGTSTSTELLSSRGDTATTIPNWDSAQGTDPANRTTVINFNLQPAVFFLQRAWSVMSRVPRVPVALRRPLWFGLTALVVLAAAGGGISVYGSRSRQFGERPTKLSAQTTGSGVRPTLAAPPEEENPPPLAPTPNGGDFQPKADSVVSPKAEFGTLVLSVLPWALVSIDGERRGEVNGVRRIRLPAGRHRIKLWHPRGSRERWVTIREGEELVSQHQIFQSTRTSLAPNTNH